MILFFIVVCIFTELTHTNAIPLLETERLEPNGEEAKFHMDCPQIGSTLSFALQADEIAELNDIYNYDGSLSHDDGKLSGYIAAGCQISSFMTDLYGKNAGTCSFELILFEPDETFIGSLIAFGTAIFDENGTSARVTIAGGGAYF